MTNGHHTMLLEGSLLIDPGTSVTVLQLSRDPSGKKGHFYWLQDGKLFYRYGTTGEVHEVLLLPWRSALSSSHRSRSNGKTLSTYAVVDISKTNTWGRIRVDLSIGMVFIGRWRREDGVL